MKILRQFTEFLIEFWIVRLGFLLVILIFTSKLLNSIGSFNCIDDCKSDKSSREYISGDSTPNCSNRETNQSEMAFTARDDTSWGYFIPGE